MRRTISAIFILFVFFILQYGKIATFLYCKWQAVVVQNKPDCGCENHLVSIFDHNDDNSSNNNHSKNTLNEKLNEFTPKTLIEVQQIVHLLSPSFTEYNSSLSESFPHTPFHPPIV